MNEEWTVEFIYLLIFLGIFALIFAIAGYIGEQLEKRK